MRDIEDMIERLHPRLPGHIKTFMHEMLVAERERCAKLAETQRVWPLVNAIRQGRKPPGEA